MCRQTKRRNTSGQRVIILSKIITPKFPSRVTDAFIPVGSKATEIVPLFFVLMMRVTSHRVSISSQRQITPLHKVRVREHTATGRTFYPCS